VDMVTTFSTAHIGGTRGPVWCHRRTPCTLDLAPSVMVGDRAVALVEAVGTFGWRLCANFPQLNRDGIPGFSANDLLAPVFTYVLLGILAAIWPPVDPVRYGRLRALLARVSLAVNVVTI
jgi:hypothetical protein